MKRTRKLMALLLALVMVLSLSVTAFATGETGTITVDNPQKDQTYKAYKIFDVTYNADKTAYAYSISGTSEWFDVLATKDGDGTATSKVTGLTFTKVSTEDTYVVTKVDGFSAASLANTLKAAVAGKTGTELTGDKPTATLPLGYYFVSSTSGALCNLTTTNPTVTIYDKNDVPFDKVDDREDVDVGDVVDYVITGKVPDTTGFETYKYQITDKMSEGLTFDNNVKVYINKVELTDTTKYTLKTGAAAGDYDFVLDIEVMKLTAGAKIEVKYTATVNEHAAGKIEHNHATLEYSNDPTNSSSTTTRQDEETVYSAKIVVDKYAVNPDNAEDKSTKLAGAKFILYGMYTPVYSFDEPRLGICYYKLTPASGNTPAKVEWVKDKKDATVMTTNENGVAEFPGLRDGTYYLEEIEAPAGYNKLTGPVTITINGASATAADVTSLTHTEGIGNNTGAMLPATGGMGTTLFYVIGSIMLLGAAVLLITKKRMSAAK